MSMDLFERWPGYNEQSWAERFAELDLRYNELQMRLIPPPDKYLTIPKMRMGLVPKDEAKGQL